MPCTGRLQPIFQRSPWEPAHRPRVLSQMRPCIDVLDASNATAVVVVTHARRYMPVRSGAPVICSPVELDTDGACGSPTAIGVSVQELRELPAELGNWIDNLEIFGTFPSGGPQYHYELRAIRSLSIHPGQGWPLHRVATPDSCPIPPWRNWKIQLSADFP
jgi:hypothetical protein